MDLPQMLRTLWGRKAIVVAQDYNDVWARHPDALADLAVFCNAASPITGANEFERGVEEGKRRVWLHIARISNLRAEDFIPISNGERNK